MRFTGTTGILTGVAAASLVLAGCATPGGAAGSPEGSGLRIVASTDVYGDIAARIGGEPVEVTSIITGPAQDPHSYEASARDQLALSRADLVIENGGGYDPFIGTLIDGLGGDPPSVLDASEASGLLGGARGADPSEDDEHHADRGAARDEDGIAHAAGENDHEHVEGFNEHIWYSVRAVDAVAHELAHELGELDPANAAVYTDNYDAFAVELDALQERARALAETTAGRTAAITEPVPIYLLEDAGLSIVTPDAFSEAIEEGTDVPPAVLRETLATLETDDVALLAHNEQTAGPDTETVRAAAEDAGVPVVEFTETLPEGLDYLGWMSANLDAIEHALSRR